MAGVFGAGVLNTLEKKNFYERVEAVYAGSAGTFNGAFFLTHQTDLGASIYFEEATRGFICPRNLVPSFLRQFYNRYIKRLPVSSMRQVLNMDYIMEVMTSKKPLDIKRLVEQKIPIYARLLNVETGMIEYIDTRLHNPLKILKAAGSIMPWYSIPQKINGRFYIDGALKESIGLRYVFEKYPHRKIILIYNEPMRRKWWYHPHNLLIYAISKVFLEFYTIPALYKIYKNKEVLVRRDLELALNNKRLLLICPPPDSPTTPITTDPEKLKITFEMGRGAAEKIFDFIR